MNAHESTLRTAVKGVAIFEALKGLAALLGLLGLLSLLHHDLHRLVADFIGHFGYSASAHYPDLLLHWVDTIVGTPHLTLISIGFAYIALRWAEAWGLWHDKAWGEWFGALSSGIYIPLEVHHIMIERHWQGVAILALNIVLMLILLWRLRDRRRSSPSRDAAPQDERSTLSRSSHPLD